MGLMEWFRKKEKPRRIEECAPKLPKPETPLVRERKALSALMDAGIRIGFYMHGGAGLEEVTRARLDSWQGVGGGFLSVSYQEKPISRPALELLPNVRRVGQLTFRNAGITDTDLEVVTRLPDLDALHLDRNPLSEGGLSHIGQIAKLRELSLHGCRGIADAALRHLSKNENLWVLSLSECSLTDAGFEHLSALNKLWQLSVRGNAINGSGLPAISRLPNLANLYLGSTVVTATALSHLESLPSLKRLDLSYCTTVDDSFLPHLTRLRTLEDLELRGTQITDAALKYLPSLPTLRKVYVERTQLSAHGIDELRKAMRYCDIRP